MILTKKIIIIFITFLSFFIITSTLIMDSAHSKDKDYTTVEDAAGRNKMLQNQIIREDYITVKDAAGKNKRIKYNKTKYNPGLAAFASIFPFYSGSLNTGFNGLGLYFIFMKLGSLGGGLAIYFKVQNSDPNNVEQLINSFYFLLALYASSTIADMIYSGIHVRHKRNEILKKIRKAYLRNKGRNYAFNVSPRIYVNHEERKIPSINKVKIEGINISAQFRF